MDGFFPHPIFEWAFGAVLLGLVAIAVYTDLRWILIPNKLVLTIAGAGLLANFVRGALLGSGGVSVWLLPAGVVSGIVDGLAFSIVGLIVGLALGIPLFGLGMAGAGDGKLLAAIGAWVGPLLILWVLLAASVVMLGLAVFRAVYVLTTSGMGELKTFYRRPDDPRGPGRLYRLMAFSPGLFLGVAILLPVMHGAKIDMPWTGVSSRSVASK